MKREEIWQENYELAKKYYKKNGNLLIPHRYKVNNNGKIVNLGNWINTQRNAYKNIGTHKLTKKQISLLEKIGMVWEVKSNEEVIPDNWMKNYKLAKKYYKKHGNLLMTCRYKVSNNGKTVNLGRWVDCQRKAYKNKGTGKITKKQMDLLEKIGMVWEVQNNKEVIPNKWLKNYELAKKYYEENGNLLIPQRYKVNSRGEIVNLGSWIDCQRRVYKNKEKGNITKKQIELLEKIGMVWDARIYNKILDEINLEYEMYQYGLLDERNVEELIKNKIFEYKDNEIVKGNAIILSRIKKHD